MEDEPAFVELLCHLNFLRVTNEDVEFMPLDQAFLETASQWSSNLLLWANLIGTRSLFHSLKGTLDCVWAKSVVLMKLLSDGYY